MKKITYLGILGASAVLSIGFFQNCSKISTADLTSTMTGQKVSADGGAAITTNSNPGTVDGTGSADPIINSDAGPVITAPDQGSPAGPVASPSSECKAGDKDCTEVQSEVKSGVKSVDVKAEIKSETNRAEVKRAEVKRAEEKKKDQEDVDAIAACLKQGSESGNHASGPKDIFVSDEPVLSHRNGHMVVRPAKGHSRGHIGKIDHHNGSIVLCNIDIDSIDNINGNVKLINCNVGRVGHITGGIKQVVSENK